MEISNRTLGILSATFILLGISMRIQSGSSNAQSGSTNGLGTVQPKPIPNSDFNLVNQYQTIQQKPVETKLGGTPNKDLINQDQAGAIVPGVTKVEDDSQPAANSDEEQQQAQADAYVQGYNDSAANNFVAPMSNNSVIDTTVGSLDPDDQAGFAMMWSAMTPAQRDRIRSSLGQ